MEVGMCEKVGEWYYFWIWLAFHLGFMEAESAFIDLTGEFWKKGGYSSSTSLLGGSKGLKNYGKKCKECF